MDPSFLLANKQSMLINWSNLKSKEFFSLLSVLSSLSSSRADLEKAAVLVVVRGECGS